MGTRTCIGVLVAAALLAPSAASAKPRLRVDAASAVPGQVLVLTLPKPAKHVKVKIGGKRAKLLAHHGRKLQVRVPALKPRRVRISVQRLRAPLRILAPFRAPSSPRSTRRAPQARRSVRRAGA